MRPLFAPLIALAAAAPAAADLRDYGKCIDMAQISPEEVRREAIAWYADTGNPGALHCEAVALSEMGALSTAANKLQETAQLPGVDDLTRVDLLTQAALLWREEGDANAAFGAGRHFCIGAPLARLELVRALPVLFERCSNLRCAGAPAYGDTYHFHGLSALPVRVD